MKPAIVFRVFPDLRLVYCFTASAVTDRNLADLRDQLRKDPLFDPDFDQLVECRHSPPSTVTTSGIVQAALGSVFSLKSRRAIVAVHDSSYGMARMFEQLQPEGAVVKIFRSTDDAKNWLGIPPETFAQLAKEIRGLQEL